MRVETEDGARRSVAVRAYAGHLASALSAPMDLMHVEDVRLSLALKALYGSRGRPAASALLPVGKRGQVRRLIVEGIPATEILRFSRLRPSPQLLVIGTRGKRGLRTLVLGSVAETLIQESRIPVMTVGPKAKVPQKNPFEGTKRNPPRILVATDLGRACRKVEAYGGVLARLLGADVTLVHSPFGEKRKYDELEATLDGQGDLREQVDAALEKRRRALERQGVRCTAVLETRETFTWQSVLRVLDGDHQLVVTGTRSRPRLARAFVGSTARELILRSPVPVMTLSIRI